MHFVKRADIHMRSGRRGKLYGRRQTGIIPAHLGLKSGLGLLSQSESMSSPSPSLSLPIADRLRPDRATLYVHPHIHIHMTARRTRSGILRERDTQETCRTNADKERNEKDKRFLKNNYDAIHFGTSYWSFFLTVSGNGVLVRTISQNCDSRKQHL